MDDEPASDDEGSENAVVRPRRFTGMPSGRHFAAAEEPDLLADDLTAFLSSSDVGA
jgi:hypothetical protein